MLCGLGNDESAIFSAEWKDCRELGFGLGVLWLVVWATRPGPLEMVVWSKCSGSLIISKLFSLKNFG